MKVYVAGASSEMELCAQWIRKVRECGHEIILDWVEVIRKAGSANPRDASIEQLQEWAKPDFDASRNCEIFWLLIPETNSIGCWVELGIALDSVSRSTLYPGVVIGPHIIISGDWKRTIFSALADELFYTHEQAFQSVFRERHISHDGGTLCR